MTISQYIVKMLSNYDGLSIDMNHVADGSDQYGLFKSPSRDLKEMTDGSCEITEYYNLSHASQPDQDQRGKNLMNG